MSPITHSLPKKRDTRDKKRTLSQVLAAEKRLRKTDPDFDWRDRFWSEALEDPHVDDDIRACVATMMTIAPRPKVLVEGITVHALRSRPQDKNWRLLFKVPGSKLSDIDFFDDPDASFMKRSQQDLAEIERMKTDGEVVGYNMKGQRFIYIEVECVAPEARWLYQYVRGDLDGRWDPATGRGQQADFTLGDLNIGRDEENRISDYVDDFYRVKTVRYRHDFRADPPEMARKSDGERDKFAVTGFGKRVSRIAKKALPGFRGSVTPYVFRHAHSSDVKALPDLEIDFETRSAAMSHASGRTVSRYGNRNSSRGCARGAQMKRVITPSPVRNVPTHNAGWSGPARGAAR